MAIGDIVARSDERLGDQPEPTILTCTEGAGLVRQVDKFKKRIAADDTSQYKVVRRGDVVYNPYLLWKGAIAQSAYEEACITSPVYEVLRPRPGVTTEYVGLVLTSPALIREYDVVSVGSIERRRRAVFSSLSEIVVTLPTLAEQRRIVDLVLTVDHYARAIGSVESASSSSYGALLRELFDGEGSGWPRQQLGALAETRLGKMLDSKRLVGESFPYLANVNVRWDEVRTEGLKTVPLTDAEREELVLRAGDVLVCEGGEAGRCAVLERDLPGIYFQKAIHRVRCGPNLRPRFLMHFMRYAAANGLLADFLSSLTIQHLTGEKLRRVPVPAPPLESQDNAVAVLDAVTSVSRRADALRRASLRGRGALLADLLSGKNELPAAYDRFLVVGAA